MTVDVVLFDLDGTLLDHEGSVHRALAQWLPTFGVDPRAIPAVTQEWLLAEERHFTEWRAGRISFAEQRRRRLRDILPLLGEPVGNDHALDSTFEGYLAAYEEAWQAFDDAVPCLDALASQGVRCALLTNGTEDQQHKKLRRTRLRSYFDAVFTAEGLGTAKPQPQAYLSPCRTLDVRPETVLHVGDHADLDVRAPREAGLQAVHLDRASHGPYRGRSRIAALSDLPAYIASL